MKKYFPGLIALMLSVILASAFNTRSHSSDPQYYFFPPGDQSEPAFNVEFTTLDDAEATFCDGAGIPCRDAYSPDQVSESNGILTAAGSADFLLQKR